MFIRNLKVRSKLLLLIGVVIIGFLGSISIGIATLNKVKVGSKLYTEIKNYKDLLEEIEHLKGDLNGVRILSITMLSVTDRDVLDQLHNKIKESIKDIESKFNEAINRSKEEDIRTALTSAQFTWAGFINTMENEYVSAINSGDASEALEIAMGMQNLRQDRFVEQVNSAVNTARLKVEEVEENVNKIVKKNIIFLIFGSTVLTLVVISFTVFIAMSITKPLHKLTTAAEIIGKGYLSRRAEVETRDEIGELATSFNKMAEDLKSSRGKLEQVKAELEDRVKERTKHLAQAKELMRE